MAKASVVTLEMLGEKSLKDWNTLQNFPYTHEDIEYKHVRLNDGWLRKHISNADAEESYYIGGITNGAMADSQRHGFWKKSFFTRVSGVLAAVLITNKDINPDWLKTFTWPKWSSDISFPTINKFALAEEFRRYIGERNLSEKLFGRNSTIKFNDHFKWTYLGNTAFSGSNIYLVMLNGEAKICDSFDIVNILVSIYFGSDD